MSTMLFRILRLPALALMGFTLVMGGIAASIAFTEYLSNRFQHSYPFLDPRMDEFKETASGARNKTDSALQVASLQSQLGDIAKAPKIVAITSQAGIGDSGWIKRRFNQLDPLMLSLPTEWQPKTAEEVNVVVACSWRSELFGEYSNGAKAYVDVGQFSVYDLQSGLLLFEGTAVGGEPPTTTKSKGTVYGSRGDSDVVEQIRKGFEGLQQDLVLK
jgi:hypothetical protein